MNSDTLCPNWRIVGTSIQGASHRQNNIPCQDWFCTKRVMRDGQPCLVLAVADGAGSAPYSQIGAFVAVRSVIWSAATLLEHSTEDLDTITRTAPIVARQAVLDEARRLQSPPSALASTLILVIVTPRQTTAFQIGDGVVVALSEGTLVALTKPYHGEYANETIFLTSKDALNRTQMVRKELIAPKLALATDGLEDLMLEGGIPHQGFFVPLFDNCLEAESPGSFQQDLRKLLLSKRVSDRTKDDLTILLAVPVSSA